jgi:hypothetical protein
MTQKVSRKSFGTALMLKKNMKQYHAQLTNEVYEIILRDKVIFSYTRNSLCLRESEAVIAQAVSRWLPTAAARVRAQVRSCGNCGGHNGTGAGFLRTLRFFLPIIIPPISPHSSSTGAGTKGQTVADVPSELSLTPPQET